MKPLLYFLALLVVAAVCLAAGCRGTTPIRERYQVAYGQDSGTVLLLLRPLPRADDQPLVYQF